MTQDRSLNRWLSGHVVVCDGAMGTMLHAAGVPLDRCASELNLTRPDLVRDLHAAYVAAGADVVQTNTFDANRLRLLRVGLAGRVLEVNIAGARLAREAARQADRTVLVAGSVGPAIGTANHGGLGRAQRRALLSEQVAALTDWVDLIVLETFGDLESMVQAVEVAAESDLPVVAQMTFSTDGRTLRGEEPAVAAQVLGGYDLAAIGANCTVGPASLHQVVAEMAAHCRLPLCVQPNAGLPRRQGQRLRYAHNPDYFAREAAGFVSAGAAIVGGCCGTTPAHTRAIAHAVAGLTPATRAGPDPAVRGGVSVITKPREAEDPLPAGWPHPGRFTLIAGLQAPRGQDLQGFLAQAQDLGTVGIDLVAITEPPPPAAPVNPVAAAVLLRERVGADVIVHMETADRTLAALQADLLGAHALGIHMVVCRTGTPRVTGDYPDPGSLWDVDAVRLIAALAGLNDGVDWRGVTAPERTRFVIGAAVSTAPADEARELARAEEKTRAGAHFLVTDTIYDVAGAERILTRLRQRIDVPVIAAVAPFQDPTTVARLAHEEPAVSLPTSAVSVAQRCADDDEESARHALRIVERLRHLIAGVVVHAPVVPSSETASAACGSPACAPRGSGSSPASAPRAAPFSTPSSTAPAATGAPLAAVAAVLHRLGEAG